MANKSVPAHTHNGEDMERRFCPAGNENGDFKYLHVKQGGGEDHCHHNPQVPDIKLLFYP